MKPAILSVKVTKLDPRLKTDALLVPVVTVNGQAAVPTLPGLAPEAAKRLRELARRHYLSKKAGMIESTVLPADCRIARLVLVSLGKDKPVKSVDVRNAAAITLDWCAKHGAQNVAVAVDALRRAAGEQAAALWTEGAILGSFRFVQMKSKAPENGETVSTLSMATAGDSSGHLAGLVDRAAKTAHAVNLARTIAHEPPNVINPVTLATRVSAVARQHKLRCKVLDDRQLRAMKMGAILAVGNGSVTKPRIIILEHPGAKPNSQPVVLVGKALTLDTGGYSLKPGESIPEMKYDKCGGMAVIGAMVAAASLKLKQRVVGIIGAAENMISGEAYRPSDIITAANGTTIEVISTDAEGRLVLADCLNYAEKTYRPATIIDLATLTGACTIALGEHAAGLFSPSDQLARTLAESGDRTDERVWRMPMWPAYREQIVSNDADIKNTGGRAAGSITAALFLKEFVSDRTPWAHIDIAGVAFIGKAQPTCPIGATGFGVRLLTDYLLRRE